MTLCEHGCGTELPDDWHRKELHTPERCRDALRALLDQSRHDNDHMRKSHDVETAALKAQLGEARAAREGFEAMAYNRGCDLEAAEKRAAEVERELAQLKREVKVCAQFSDPGAEHWGDCECYGERRPKLDECTCPVGALALLSALANSPGRREDDEPSKPGGGEP